MMSYMLKSNRFCLVNNDYDVKIYLMVRNIGYEFDLQASWLDLVRLAISNWCLFHRQTFYLYDLNDNTILLLTHTQSYVSLIHQEFNILCGYM